MAKLKLGYNTGYWSAGPPNGALEAMGDPGTKSSAGQTVFARIALIQSTIAIIIKSITRLFWNTATGPALVEHAFIDMAITIIVL